MTTFSEYQDISSSEKIVLATIEPAKRLIGFTLHSGSIYKISSFSFSVISSIKDSGVALTEVSSLGAVVAGSFYNDKVNKVLYLRTSDSVNPSTKFLVMSFKMFFSNVPISLPHDLSSGFQVEWVPYILSTSEFGVELDNENQQGFAIDGSGSITLANVQDFWSPIFDKYTFENKSVHIYSYYRELPVTQAKLIYKGKITSKTWSSGSIQFGLKDVISELKKQFELENIEDLPSAIVPNNLKLAKQRYVYGYLNGHVPTPIDQIIQGYEGTGSIDTVFGSLNITGTGTSFLSELSPDDQIRLDDSNVYYTVAKIFSDTLLELTEEFAEGTSSGKDFIIKPSLPNRYKNRKFLVAGHATRQPETTVTNPISLNYFEVASDLDLRVGDKLQVGTEFSTIRRVSNNRVKLNTTLTSLPSVGTSVIRPSLSDVYIGSNRLLDDSFSYDANTGILELDQDAEFRIAPIKRLLGTSITITNGSRTVTGVDTFFDNQLKPGDWVRIEGQAEFFEVLQIISDTELELRTQATYTGTNIPYYRSPDYYKEGSSVLSVNLIGKTDNGLKTGNLIKTAALIVKDILEEAGLSTLLNNSSFTESSNLAPQRLGIAIPEKMNETKTKTIKEIVGTVSSNVFGSLVQNSDFELAYRVLSPKRMLSDKKLREVDVLSFNINSSSEKIIKTALVNYDFREFDFQALSGSNRKVSHTPKINEFLTGASVVNTYDLRLIDDVDAEIIAERYAFLLQLSRAKINIDTKLTTMLLSATDRVWLSHEKLYERIGTVLDQKIGGVESIKKSGSKVSLEVEDLSNAFSRCAIITEDSSLEYDLASYNELLINGFITDEYGLVDGEETYGINLIW